MLPGVTGSCINFCPLLLLFVIYSSITVPRRNQFLPILLFGFYLNGPSAGGRAKRLRSLRPPVPRPPEEHSCIVWKSFTKSLTRSYDFFKMFFFFLPPGWGGRGCHRDGFIALDPSGGQVRGATARLMSVAGNWQMEASISPLIRGCRSPETDRVQAGNVVPASSHPARFIKRSLIPRHNIINFVSG